MRVIAGQYRGRTLAAPQGTNTRPTADRTREALFHILTTTLPRAWDDLRVLDLFCGSGALAIEALSRGAIHATLVDGGADAIATTKANLKSLGLQDRARVVHGELPRALTTLPRNTGYNLVFADPPYALDPAPTLNALLELSADNAVLCVEHGASARPIPPRGWRLLQRRTWGQTTISFFRREPRSSDASGS